MVMTLQEFTEVFQFIAQLIYGSFKAWDVPLYSDGDVTVSILTIMIGLFAADLLIGRILDWIRGA